MRGTLPDPTGEAEGGVREVGRRLGRAIARVDEDGQRLHRHAHGQERPGRGVLASAEAPARGVAEGEASGLDGFTRPLVEARRSGGSSGFRARTCGDHDGIRSSRVRVYWGYL
jgi:hypothetical protein